MEQETDLPGCCCVHFVVSWQDSVTDKVYSKARLSVVGCLFANIQNAVLALALTSFLRHVCGQCLLGILASDLSQLLNTLLLQA